MTTCYSQNWYLRCCSVFRWASKKLRCNRPFWVKKGVSLMTSVHALRRCFHFHQHMKLVVYFTSGSVQTCSYNWWCREDLCSTHLAPYTHVKFNPNIFFRGTLVDSSRYHETTVFFTWWYCAFYNFVINIRGCFLASLCFGAWAASLICTCLVKDLPIVVEVITVSRVSTFPVFRVSWLKRLQQQFPNCGFSKNRFSCLILAVPYYFLFLLRQ